MRSKFAVFVISHGRPTFTTYNNLREYGYTGKIYIVLDNEDTTIDLYKSLYPEEDILVFNKREYIEKTDTLDNFDKPNNIPSFARNFCILYAKENKYDFIDIIDDDLVSLKYRYVDDEGVFRKKQAINLDYILDVFIDTVFSNENIILSGFFSEEKMRSGKNIKLNDNEYQFCEYFLRVDKSPLFTGRIFEDDIYNQNLHNKSFVFSIPLINKKTIYNLNLDKKQDGGLKDIYKSLEKYRYMMNMIMSNPSSVNKMLIDVFKNTIRFRYLKSNNFRICILNEKNKKY